MASWLSIATCMAVLEASLGLACGQHLLNLLHGNTADPSW